MKKSLLSFSYSLIFLVGIIIPYPLVVFTAEAVGGMQGNLSVDQTVTYPNPINISLGNIPKSEAYVINLLGPNMTCETTAPIIIAQETVGIADDGTCIMDPDKTSQHFTNTSCSNNTFSGQVSTQEIGDNINDGSNTLHVCVYKIPSEGTDTPAADKFTVVTKGSGGSTDHKMIDAFNTNGRTNAVDNPAQPGEDIGIHLTGASSKEYLVLTALGEPAIATAKCDTDACGSVIFTLPKDFSKGTTSIVLYGDNDQYLEPITIWINQAKSLPTPTPLPPPPPCAQTLNTNEGCTSIWSAIGPLNTDSFSFIGQLFAILLSISGGIALLLIIRSGYQLMTSQGNPEKVKEARERLTSVFVGLLFLVLSIIILEVIGVDLLNLPGLTK
ncbi:MAG: pilin [Patescibacteria group bacterium]